MGIPLVGSNEFFSSQDADLSEIEMMGIAQAMDCYTWISQNKLELTHGPWELPGHEYQLDWLQCDAPQQIFIKGAQIGATEVLVLNTLHGMIHSKYPAGSLYLFPTRDDVRDFSKSRFDPLISNNPFIGAFVQNTDAQNIKQIGRGFLYLRGARSTKSIGGTKKSSSQLKSIPVDRVIFDELDEMEESMIQLAKERISHSKVGELMFLGTPTIPDYGTDAMYQKSDMRAWFLQCPKCGKETCLDLEFPNSIRRRLDGTAYRACIYCAAELHPSKGRWVAQNPSKSKDLVGWWISQLNSLTVDPTYILDLYEDPPYGDLSEVMNSKLGRAYIPAENRLTQQDVFACCGNEPMLTKHDGPTCMGVDVGNLLHVVIAERKTRNTLKIVKVCRVSSFTDLHDLTRDFNVKSAVIDLFPEQRKVREFQRQHNFSVFGCQYVETRSGQIVWDEKDLTIKCNRTEICDASHELVSVPGRLEIPRRNEELNEYVKEMCNIAKVLDEDKDTGSRMYRYKKVGTHDHYRHATNYCMLAADRTGISSDQKIINRFWAKRRKRSWMTA
jgi:hypothetical protein